MMRSKIIALALAGSGASAVVLPRGDGCCFQVTASGGKSGTVGQLGDGQNRIGGGYSPATYCINNGGITDSNGRGCILTSPTTQWQCDVGATPTTGFSISAEGEIQYNGSGKFYACGATSTEYNIYSVPVKDQKNCVEVTLSSGGKCSSNGNGGGASSSSAASSVKSTVSSKATSEMSTTAQASSSSMHWGPGPVSPPPSMSSETHPATTSPVKMTTSTVYTTTVSTITSCAASVTNCPAESQTTAVVTKTVAISTTVCPVTETETKPSPPATHETMMPPPATHETMPPPPATHETMPSPPATHETMAPPPATHETMPPPPATYETMPSPPATHDTMPPPPATHETMPPPPATSPNVPMTTACAQCPPAMTVTVTVTQGCEMPTAPPAMSMPSAPPASSMASAPPASSKPSAPPASSKPSAPPASSMPSAPPATSAKGGPACQTSLTGAYQTPHLIVPISSEHPDSAYGTSYNGEINSTMSSIFNFDIPQDYKGKQCSIIFLFPKKEDLETSNYDFSGSGSLGCSELSSAANQKTSWSNAPAVKSDLGSIALQPGNSYVVATQDCKAGTTQSIELSSKDGLSLNFFEDYNPSPLGLYITSC